MKNRLLIAVLLFVQPFLMTGRPVILDQNQQPEVFQSYQAASQGLGVNLVSQLGGYVKSILAQGHYVYAGFGPELAVLDISNPAHPKHISSILVAGEVQDLYIEGHYLYLAYGSSNSVGLTGLVIIDISIPTVPVIVASKNLQICAFNNPRIAAKGQLVYLGLTKCQRFGGIIQNAGASLYSIDVSVPESPVVLESLDFPPMTGLSGLAIAGENAYILFWDVLLKLEVVDISNPGDMNILGSVEIAEQSQDIAIKDNIAYIAAGVNGIQVVDVTNSTNPQVLTSYTLPGTSQRISISGDYAYLAAGSAGLRVVDISNPSAPFEAGFYDTPDNAMDVSVAGRFASVADGWGGVRVINISDLTHLTQVGAYEVPTQPNDIAEVGSYAFIAANDGLWVMDVSHPTDPALINSFATPGRAVALLLAGNVAYVADFDHGVRVVDIAYPQALAEVGFINISGNLTRLSKAGNKVYVATEAAGLHILDVSTPTTPVEIGHLGTTYGINDVAVSGNYAYLASANGDLRIVNISKPAAPIEISSYDLPHIFSGGSATSLAVAGHYVYITTVENGPTPLAGCCYGKVYVIDVSIPRAPKQIGVSSIYNAPYRVTFSNGLVYIANGQSGLTILDVSNPAAPAEVASFATVEPIYGVTASEDRIYIFNQSIYMLSYADPAALPTISGRVTGWNHRPYQGASVSAGAWLHSLTDSQGRYQFTGLVPGAYSLTSGTPGTVFLPSARDLILPPGLSDQDFVILPAPVSMTLRPALAATLTYTDTQGLPTRLEVPAGAVDLFATLQLTPTLATADPGYAFTGHAFILDIDMNTSPTNAWLPNFTFNSPIQVTIQYSAADTQVISDMDALTLGWRTTGGWQDAAQTCDPPSVYTRDLQNKTITISICKTGTFALVGPTHSYYLPLVR